MVRWKTFFTSAGFDSQKLYLRVPLIDGAMNRGEKLEAFVDRMKQHANVDTVYGEPIEREGKTVVPVAKMYGFGGGYGSEGNRGQGENGKDDGGEGVGMGGGVNASPAGVVEITDDETRLIKFTNMKKIALVAGFFLVLGYLLGRD